MTFYKLETYLQHFRFNHIIQTTAIKVQWFVYNEKRTDDETRPFDYEELTAFQQFVSQHLHNFPGIKNYFIAVEEEAPNCDEFKRIADEDFHFPKNVILSANPILCEEGIATCMHIILIDENGHDINASDLPFNVVAKIWV